MRALFMKNIIILMFFLAVGLTIFTLMAMELGFDRAFVIPQLRVPEEVIGGWILYGLVFGWTVGASDQIRGLTQYIQHRGYSKIRLFCTEQSLTGLVLLLVLIVPGVVLAIGGGQLFEPDYVGVGGRWLAASTLLLPCYGIGLFLARVPMHFAIRMTLIIPMIFWIIGDNPDRTIDGSIYSAPLAYAAGNIALTVALLVGSYLSTMAGNDRDLPEKPAVIFPVILILIGSGWALHAFSSTAMATVTHGVDKLHIASKPDGSYVVGRMIKSDLTDHYDHWEVDPATNASTTKNDELAYIEELSLHSSRIFSDAGSTHHGIESQEHDLFWKIRAFIEFSGGAILHITQEGPLSGMKQRLDKGGRPFSGEARLLDSHVLKAISEFWVGDPADGSLWLADFAEANPSYAQVHMPEGVHFRKWLQLYPSMRHKVKQHGTVVREVWGQQNTAYIQTNQGYYRLRPDSRKVLPLTAAQEQWVAANQAKKQTQTVHTTKRGLFFHRKQILDLEGEALFTYDFAPRTIGERFTAVNAALVSFMQPPILEPKAFGNITHVERIIHANNGYGINPLRDPTRYGSMHAISNSRLHWTGYSPWSAIAWVLLLGLAYLNHLYLVRAGAKGARLWLWPLAAIAFGPLGYILCLAMEPKRAFYPVSKTAADRKTVFIGSPA